MPYMNIWVDLEDFDDDELVRETESRGYKCIKKDNVLPPNITAELYLDLSAYGWTKEVKKKIEEFLYSEVRVS